VIAERIGLVLLAVSATVVIAWAYLLFGDRLISRLPRRLNRRVMPWLFVAPAVFVIGCLLVFPAISTVVLSLFDKDGSSFVGMQNYTDMLSNEITQGALRNTVLWVIALPSLAALLGLLVAVLAERVRYGTLVKATLFLPIAISPVAAGVIWTFMYDYQPPITEQTGTMNALVTLVPDTEPIAWLISQATNNWALIAAMLWTQAGFAMVIFSAALGSVPVELHEAARLDGASEWHVFRRITLPLLIPTVVVVMTAMTVIALKTFDIVYVMTNGNYGTDVIATVMYKELFTARDNGTAGAVATLLMLAVLPIIFVNIRQFRLENKEA